MVDNGKYRIIFRPASFSAFIKKLGAVANVEKKVDLKDFKTYRLYLFNNVKSLDKENTLGKPCLEINIKYWYGEVTVDITNSLRKWFYGARSLRDFNLTDLWGCYRLIATKLSIPFNLFLKARIHNIEVGFNLKFDKSFSSSLLTFIEHRRLKTKNILGAGTRNFEGENLKLTFYDKLKEMFDHDTILENTYRKISNQFFVLRIEVGFTKVSGVEFANLNLRTVKDLLNNFSEIYQYLVKQVREVTIIDWISPRIADKIATSDNKVFFSWLISLGIDTVGLDNLFIMADKDLSLPWRAKKKLTEIAESFRSLKKPSYRTLIFERLLQREKLVMQ